MELGNPVWHALRGPQATVAEGGPLAFRYQHDVAVFAALPDDATPDAWEQLRDARRAEGYAFLAREVLEPPAGWEQAYSLPAVQMVATSVDGRARRGGAAADRRRRARDARARSSEHNPGRSASARSSWASTSASATVTAR